MSEIATAAGRTRRSTPQRTSDAYALRIPDAAAHSGLGRSTIYELIRSGELPSVKRAGRRLILREALEAYVRGNG